MKVLVVTNMLPIADSPYFGIFVKEQIEGIQKYYPQINPRIYFINGKKNRFNYLWSIIRVNWLLLFKRFDLIHIHYGLSGFFLLLNPFIKIPIITTLHGSDFNASQKTVKKIVKEVLKRSTDIIYLNNTMLEKLKKYGKRMHHIPCGVDTEVFKPGRTTKSDEPIKIAFPSSKLRPEKNYPFFNEIIEYLEEVHSFKISVVEIDNKTRHEINVILNSVDLLCMTSLTEGSPQIIKEAMCCNTPIVSTNVGDVAVLLTDVNNTTVINDYNKIKFAEAIIEILAHKSIQRAKNGRDRVFELGLDERSTSEKLFKVYTG